MKGLSEKEVIASREKYGSNELDAYKKKSFFKVFLSNFSDPIIRVLIIALFINIAVLNKVGMIVTGKVNGLNQPKVSVLLKNRLR